MSWTANHDWLEAETDDLLTLAKWNELVQKVSGIATDVSGNITTDAGLTTAGAINAWWVIDAGGNKVENIATPTVDTDAANKAYVDSKSSSRLTSITSEQAASSHRGALTICLGLEWNAEYSIDGDTTTVHSNWRLATVGNLMFFEDYVSGANYLWTDSFYDVAHDRWYMRSISNSSQSYAVSSTLKTFRCVR